ncbi:hypothetical protein EU803_07670 [Loktanella sp. IMCC34160]|uniref:hypothetical protein n=1 Tax=Loktanella sp. IMCC34160 TaxID=2510646 RepID=UPI00101CAF39|nr:hypothetical protein [Loktanella sp. IMCC34160]RYG92302.1 hypothetical protein EU803_07670 [Loktanella sp. IMCC34160]
MTQAAFNIPAETGPARPLFTLPLFGALFRAMSDSAEATIFVIFALAVLAIAGAVVLWGLPALVLSALAVVPMMFAFYIAISWPFGR